MESRSMWISSFVVTLPDDESRANAIGDAIQSIPVFEPGEAVGGRLPVVLEAEDGFTARYWHQWVEDLPGVVHIDVAFVSFADDEQLVAAPESVTGPSQQEST